MPDERWDVPSERLRRIAATENTPQLRRCPACDHNHPKAQRCDYPIPIPPTKSNPIERMMFCRCDR